MKQASLSQCLRGILLWAVENCPHNTAVCTDTVSLSYVELLEWVCKVHYSFRAEGLGQGDRVVCALGNVIEGIVAFWATVLSDAVICMATPDDETQLQGIINSCEPVIVISNLPVQCPRHYSREGIQSLVHSNNSSFSKSLLTPDALAMLLYTSGSTGAPKGVMMSHASVIFVLGAIQAYLEYQSTDVVLCALPIHFDYGLYQMLLCFQVGATLYLSEHAAWPHYLIQSIQRMKVTILPVVPTLLTLLSQTIEKYGGQLGSVRILTNTGAALSRNHYWQLERYFPDAKMISMYGLTECKRCTYLPPEYWADKYQSVGMAIPGTQCLVKDAEGQVCPPGEVGELVVTGPHLMMGYWQDPSSTQEKLKMDPVTGKMSLYTGDLAEIDEEGFITLRGRRDDACKHKGKKIFPLLIEQALLQALSIREVATWIGKGKSGDSCLFVVVGGPCKTQDYSDLLTFLGPYAPYSLHFFSSLPKTSTLKIDRPALYEMALTEKNRDSPGLDRSTFRT